MQGLRDPSAAMWHVLQLALAAVCGLARLSALPAPTARKPLSRRRSSSAAAGRERMLQVQRTMYDRTSEPTYFPSGPLLLTGYITLEIGIYSIGRCRHSETVRYHADMPVLPLWNPRPRVHYSVDCPSRREDPNWTLEDPQSVGI